MLNNFQSFYLGHEDLIPDTALDLAIIFGMDMIAVLCKHCVQLFNKNQGLACIFFYCSQCDLKEVSVYIHSSSTFGWNPLVDNSMTNCRLSPKVEIMFLQKSFDIQ